ncbi:trypsin [Pseudonocardiaceae bacterium YIM PH 21723]|nr:trypsin [Pseudonocardiaceae bacterium YIM PH 21723]
MKIKLMVGAAALALATAAVAIPSGAFSVNEVAAPKPIIGGSAGTYSPAARLLINGVGNCTSTLIKSQWILTAKHCVTGSSGYSFNIGSTSDTGGIKANGTTVVRHPSADIALVKLDKAVSSPTATLASTDPSTGSSINVYGWGATKPDRCPNEGGELNCQSPYLKTAKAQVTGKVTNSYGVNIGLRGTDGGVGGGDSGGPAVNAAGQQVGVASTSDRKDKGSFYYISVATYLSWIQQNAV